MVYFQAFKGSNRHKAGRKGKEYWRYIVIIPRALIDALEWKKGDDVEFKIQGSKIYLKKKNE